MTRESDQRARSITNGAADRPIILGYGSVSGLSRDRSNGASDQRRRPPVLVTLNANIS